MNGTVAPSSSSATAAATWWTVAESSWAMRLSMVVSTGLLNNWVEGAPYAESGAARQDASRHTIWRPDLHRRRRWHASSLPLGEVVPRAHLLDSDHDVYSCRLTVHLHGRSEAHRLSSNLHDHRGVYIAKREEPDRAGERALLC